MAIHPPKRFLLKQKEQQQLLKFPLNIRNHQSKIFQQKLPLLHLEDNRLQILLDQLFLMRCHLTIIIIEPAKLLMAELIELQEQESKILYYHKVKLVK